MGELATSGCVEEHNGPVGRTAEHVAPAPRPRLPKRLLALRGDDALVARLQAGDEVAFEVLFDRYSAPLLSFCRHMLGRTDEAEDAVQQVFASAHGDLQRNPRQPQLKPWLYAIARNRCLTMLRARREQPSDEVDFSTSGLQEQVQARADLRELVADLAHLPENQRAALLLTELEDLSHADAATVLDCEASQVKGLVCRARQGLIERRDARSAPCEEIRAELSTARKGALRRGRLRHHLAECPGCAAYLEDVRRQRRMMALILPVIPATGFKRGVLAAVGIGGGAGGAGGATVVGGSILSGTAAKVATVAVLAGGAGVATEQAVDRNRQPASDPAPAAAAPATPARSAAPPSATPMPAKDRRPARAPGGRAVSSPGRKAKTPRGAGITKGKSRSNRGVSPPGLTRGPAKQRAGGRQTRPVTPPGQIRKAPAPSPGSPAQGSQAPSPRAGPKERSDKPVPKGLLKD